MVAILHKPSGKEISALIDYFIFFDNEKGNGSYCTFPNSNLCLAIYKSNIVEWDKASNICTITDSGKPISSKLYGFHKQRFTVEYSGQVDQVCILFKPGALSSFTRIPLNEISGDDDPLIEIFGKDGFRGGEQIFETESSAGRINILESFLLERIIPLHSKQLEYLEIFSALKSAVCDEKVSIGELSLKFGIDPSTLYRNFLKYFGQHPQYLYRTMRFRNVLSGVLSENLTLTRTTYENAFFDQAHMIKDFRELTGEAPSSFRKKVNVVDDKLVWLRC
jgi:AraC-like DNA-binding protein